MASILRQQLALLLIAVMALQLSHAWLLKLPKLEELTEKLDEKEHKEALKKLDFLNLFAAKDEKKENEWEKIKQWFEDKKLKEISLFEAKKEKELEKLEDKLHKKSGKKGKKLKLRTTTECYNQHEYTTKASYVPESEEHYQEEEEQEEEEVLVQLPKKLKDKKPPCNCQPNTGYDHAPTAYDVREDFEEGVRYFT
ncbi:glutamic acid-rich protein [Drosophila virilis]|uniref:Uncharacterized protein n=1 Tax=Drosophila virilis TaxID=7244 RepID=B4M7N4_DROVI|nr:uncharacterized protein LOC6633795 [Drosophila virilis]EDW62801.1 uncharacterized protein Dvir_GJ16420 [Drosophila virilis]